LLVAVVQVKEVGGEGLGTMFATAGGRFEEAVEAEKGCNHVQARTKGRLECGDRPLDSDCCIGKTDVLPCLGGTSRAH
jgi:hypothetical protein